MFPVVGTPSRHRLQPICMVAASIALLFAFPIAVSAQDSLTSLQQQWQDIDERLDEAEEILSTGTGDLEQVREQYSDLVGEANGVIEKIRAAAIDTIQADAAEKNPATRALMGILLNEAQAGDDDTVLKTGDFLIEQKIKPIWFETAAKSERLSIEGRELFDELLIRQREALADDLPRVKLVTNKGDIVVELYENQAPDTVGNFISLVEAGQYTDIVFHRVLEGFMAQTGGFKPDGSGGDGPGYEIKCECHTPETRPHFSGCLSMAHRGKDTGGSQFFITLDRTDFLDGKHTVFGRVVEGHDILDQLQRTHVSINRSEREIPDIKKDVIKSAEVIRKRDHEYRPNNVGDEDNTDVASETETTESKPPASPDLSPPKAASQEAKPIPDAASTDATETSEPADDVETTDAPVASKTETTDADESDE